MTDYFDDDDSATREEQATGVDDDPPIYRSGRVRIIGAEPAGHAVREDAEPADDSVPDMPHWNDAPTGQVPAILDRGTSDDSALAPPIWREEDTDLAAHEEAFEPSMLSDDLPAVGALINDNNDQVDVERQPWHFADDDLGHDDETIVIEPRFDPLLPPPPVVPTRSATAAASRLTPPEPPQPRVRAPRQTRLRDDARNSNGGTSGRNMRVAVGSGLLLGVVALICFKLGNLAAVVISTAVVLLAAAEAYAAFRKSQYHPATLLGLVATLSLMVETYNKGVSALPLVLVMLVAASFVWYLSRVEPGADPVAGLASTVFVFA
ncbi:MAG TPA: hypothetical protein VNG12_10120, partial [Acidimicrobiales bacterium]|nr:hypothetical protein [Acidimicrobiales bacterium]